MRAGGAHVIVGVGVLAAALSSMAMPYVDIAWPTNGALLRAATVLATGTLADAEAVVWSNVWHAGAAGGTLATNEAWTLQVPIGFGTNTLTIIAMHSTAGSVTTAVTFVADTSFIAITAPAQDFATNIVSFCIAGTGGYLSEIMWWNLYSTSNHTGMRAGNGAWSIDICGAGQGSNQFIVWGISLYGYAHTAERWYWIDSIAPALSELTPTNGAEVAPPTVELTWNLSEPAVCDVYTNSALAGANVGQRLYLPVGAGAYTWWVVARDALGNTACSPTNSFVVPEVGTLGLALLVFWTVGDVRKAMAATR